MDPLLERAHGAKGGLQFDVHHRAVADQRQGFEQRRNTLVGPGQPQLAELGGRARADPVRNAVIRCRSSSWNTIASPSAESWTSSSIP